MSGEIILFTYSMLFISIYNLNCISDYSDSYNGAVGLVLQLFEFPQNTVAVRVTVQCGM